MLRNIGDILAKMHTRAYYYHERISLRRRSSFRERAPTPLICGTQVVCGCCGVGSFGSVLYPLYTATTRNCSAARAQPTRNDAIADSVSPAHRVWFLGLGPWPHEGPPRRRAPPGQRPCLRAVARPAGQEETPEPRAAFGGRRRRQSQAAVCGKHKKR